MSLNSFSIMLLAFAHVVMGLFVYLKSRSSWTNRFFFALTLSTAGWILADYFSNLSIFTTEQVLVFNKLVFFFPAAAIALAVLFSLSITKLYGHLPKWLRTIIYTVPLLILALCLSNQVVAGVTKNDAGTGIIFGPLSLVYFAYHLAYLGGLIPIFILGLRRADRAQKVRLQYILGGLAVTVAIALTTNLITPLIFHSYVLASLGAYATLVLLSTFAYAVVRHRLFDLRLVVATSAAYVLLLLTFSAMFGVAIFLVSHFLFGSDSPIDAQTFFNIAIAVVLSFLFQPMQRFFKKGTDRIFFRDNYDSQMVLNDFSKVLVSELQLDRILKLSLTHLCESLHIQFGQLVVFNSERVYRVEHYGKLPLRLMVAPELEKLNKPMLVADELPDGERRKLMETHSIRVSLTLRTRDEFVAYLLLGDKLSGDIYSGQDLELLEIIGKELAVAILNAKAYAQIEEFNLTLQARVDHATNRLRVANRHLKELDRAKDEFISMASHQLRTPLTTIKGYLSMMQEGDAGKLTPAQEEFVGYAFGSSERMVNLISDLLNVSRLSAGRFLIQTKPTDMVDMIRDEVRQLETHASAKHIKLIFDPPKEALPPAEIDDNKTRQVVMNFIDNAIYYTQAGEVRVVLEQSGDRVRLEVRDTGIGVPEEAKRKLFSKFYRAGNAQVVRPDGTGLGLYLAKRVVEDQGGTILFNSVEGKGSMFGFELPFKPVKPIRETAHARKH